LATAKVLLVDDDAAVRSTLQEGLQRGGFEVVAASNVSDALKQIATESFDVLLSNMHMPEAADGFTLVNAMHHMHPHALTVALSGYPTMDEAMTAIHPQADEILVKPFQINSISELIRTRLADPGTITRVKTESVASILERESQATIQNWLALVEQDAELTRIPLSHADRTGHLPKLIRDLIVRLRWDSGLEAPLSVAARDHGRVRRQQGYSDAMIVEESRLLQVSIFLTLQRNLRSVDFSKVLLDVVTIANEVDSQLKQAMLGCIAPTVMLESRAAITQVENWPTSVRGQGA
jgi:ActR/RegA family two-component response regulator